MHLMIGSANNDGSYKMKDIYIRGVHYFTSATAMNHNWIGVGTCHIVYQFGTSTRHYMLSSIFKLLNGDAVHSYDST